MNAHESRRFPARMSLLDEVLDFVEAFCAAHALTRTDALRLRLVVEELFTNTVEHGHRGECDRPVGLALALAEDAVALHYEDDAPPFDPTPRLAAQPDESPDSESAGGRGLRLVAGIAASLDYRREDGLNRIMLRIVRRRPDAE